VTEAERDAHVAHLLPVVHAIARRVARICRLPDPDDLIGDGSLGLVRAVDSFDPRRGVSFDRYARHVILGAMLNGLRRNDPVSERARRLVREAERLRAECEANGEPASDRDLEATIPGLGRARGQVERGLPLSLDAPLPLGYALHVDWSGDPALICEAHRRRRLVRRAIETLPSRQREIVLAHYCADVPLRMLSASMAVTPQRVSQIHCAALARLRNAVASEAG
jgi:RNA polymerase sigma factor FliA